MPGTDETPQAETETGAPVERTEAEQAEIEALKEKLAEIEVAAEADAASAEAQAVIDALEDDAVEPDPSVSVTFDAELDLIEPALVKVVNGLEVFYVTAAEAERLGFEIVDDE